MPRYDQPATHVIELEVRDEDIDAYSHVNNAVYLTLRHPPAGKLPAHAATQWRPRGCWTIMQPRR
jgi:acyl-ACP thioesterase